MEDASARRAFQRDNPQRGTPQRDSPQRDNFQRESSRWGDSRGSSGWAASGSGASGWDDPRESRSIPPRQDSRDQGWDSGREERGSWGRERGWEERRPGGRGVEPLDQRLERWVSRGRELVDGVSGTRPGSRTADRRSGAMPRRGPQDFQGNGGLGAAGLNPARLGRWVEDRLDWLLDEDREDDWREPWQEREERAFRAARPDSAAGGPPWPAASPERPLPSTARRSLEAISRRTAQAGEAASDRGSTAAGPAAQTAGEDGDAWPDEQSFSVPRWSRPSRSLATPPAPAAPAPEPRGADASATAPPEPGRALPRSTRRRPRPDR